MKRLAYVRWPILILVASGIAGACSSDADSDSDDQPGSAGETTGGSSQGGAGNQGGEAGGGTDQGGSGGGGGSGGEGLVGGDAGGGGTDGGDSGSGGTDGGGEGGQANGGTSGAGGMPMAGMAGIGGMGGQLIGCGSANMIDDMEDGDPYICLGGARKGGWYIVKDPATGSTIPSEGVLIMPPLLVPARAASTRGVHFQGSSFGTAGAWALIGMGITTPTDQPYDASGFQGINFWAKSDGGVVTINVKFATIASTASNLGGSCVPTMTMACGDHWQAARTITGAWQQFTIYFPNNLSQLGWGVPVPKDLAHLRDIEFNFSSSASQTGFDFWIDDVEFY